MSKYMYKTQKKNGSTIYEQMDRKLNVTSAKIPAAVSGSSVGLSLQK